MSKISVTPSEEAQAEIDHRAEKKGISKAEAAAQILHAGATRSKALRKHNDKVRKASGKAPRKAKPAKTKSTKAPRKAKTTKATKSKASKSKASKSKKSDQYTGEVLQKMKDEGMTNPQIAKETGLTRNQVFSRLKAAKKAA